MLIHHHNKKRKGAALVEYAVLVAGVALICLAAVAILGHKTNDMIAATAVILPGAHGEDNGPIFSGRLVETMDANDGPIGVDALTIAGNTGNDRLGDNLGIPNLDDLVVD